MGEGETGPLALLSDGAMRGEYPMTAEGSVIVITGASSGIGRATAFRLAGMNTKLILVARRADRLEAIQNEIARRGGDAVVVAGDITVPATMERAVSISLDRYGRLDILISNAGAGLFGTVDQTTEQDLDRMLALNFKGVFFGVRAALPIMRRQGSGHLITVASTAGRRGSPYVGAYCAAKSAVIGWTESLRTELLGSGIRVSLVCPGATRTDFFSSAVRRTPHHEGLVGPVEDADTVAARLVQVIRHPQAEVMAQPFRRKLFLAANLLAPGLIDRLLLRMVGSRRPPTEPR